LTKQIIERGNDLEFSWLLNCWDSQRKRLLTSGFTPKAETLPFALQAAIIARAAMGKFADVKIYIKTSPFAEELHMRFWRACQDKKSIIKDYVLQYPLVDEVLRRLWRRPNYGDVRSAYITKHTISKQLATEMWGAINHKSQSMDWAKEYLRLHSVPQGMVADLLNEDIPYIEGILDLMDMSKYPFEDEDEVAVVTKMMSDDAVIYIRRFGSRLAAQLAMLRKMDKVLITCYIDLGYTFDDEALRYMLSPEFIQSGKDILEHYLQVLPRPISSEYFERLHQIFG
jgi:hypothetical protein